MAIFEKRHSRGLRGTPAQKGVASKFGAATRGVSSDAEMAAKAPAGFNVLNNHIANPLYDADSRYPGAGSSAASWAGFTCTDEDYNRGDDAFYPIRITSNEQAGGSNSMLNIALSGSVPAGDSLTIRVSFTRTDNLVKTMDFEFTETSTTTKFKNTAGTLSNGDYNDVSFSFIKHNGIENNGGSFYFNTFYIIHSIDTSQTGGQFFYGGADNQNGLWTIPSATKAHPARKLSINGNGSSWIYNQMPANWKHYNSLYISDTFGEWDTLLRKKFLRERKFENEFRDIADMNTPAGVSANTGYEIGPNQRRIIEISGSNGRATDSRTQDWSPPANQQNTEDRGYFRSFPDIAMFSLTKSALVSGRDSKGGAGQNRIEHVDGFVKQSALQSIYIPNSPIKAHYCKYGAFVQAPANKLFRNGKNFGAIQVSQDRGGGFNDTPLAANNEREVYGDSIWFVNKEQRIAGHFPSQEINSFGGIGNSPETRFTQYNWNGLASAYQATASAVDSNQSPIIKAQNNVVAGHSWPSGYRYPTRLSITGITYDDTPYREFKQVERTWYGLGGNGLLHKTDMSPGHANAVQHQKQIPYLLYELCFYEHSDNLTSRNFGGSGAGQWNRSPGAIRFFCPYVKFFGRHDTPIEP